MNQYHTLIESKVKTNKRTRDVPFIIDYAHNNAILLSYSLYPYLHKQHDPTSGAHTDVVSAGTTAAVDRPGVASNEDDTPTAAIAAAVLCSHSPRVALSLGELM